MKFIKTLIKKRTVGTGAQGKNEFTHGSSQSIHSLLALLVADES
jgi:hypothetical protein